VTRTSEATRNPISYSYGATKKNYKTIATLFPSVHLQGKKYNNKNSGERAHYCPEVAISIIDEWIYHQLKLQHSIT